MKVTTEERANRELQLTIEVEPSEEENALRAAARKLAGQVNVPGFRKGKAPYPVVLGYFGREALLEEALEPLTQKLYEQALRETGIEPAAPGQIEDIQHDPLVLRMVVPLMPTVEPGPYREFRLPYDEPTVTDEMVDGQLEALRTQHAIIAPVERPAQMGDQVRGALKAHFREADGARGEQWFAEDEWETELREDEQFPAPGFSQNLVGLAAGEQKTFDVQYPDDYVQENLRGRTVAFEFTLQDVKSVTLPELDDDFAKTVGDYENLLDLRMHVREQLHAELRQQAEAQYAQQIVDALAEHAQVEYPPVLLEHELDDLVRDLESRVSREMHMNLEDYLKVRGDQSEAGLRDDLRPRAEQRLRRGLLIGEIARRENMQVDEEELHAEIERLVEPFGEQADYARRVFADERSAPAIMQDLLTRKAVRRLVAIARGEAADETTGLETATAEAADGAESGTAPEVAAPAAEVVESPEAAGAGEASEAAEAAEAGASEAHG